MGEVMIRGAVEVFTPLAELPLTISSVQHLFGHQQSQWATPVTAPSMDAKDAMDAMDAEARWPKYWHV